jgi:hypothetical protein
MARSRSNNGRRVLDPADERQRVHEPERAGQERALLSWQAVAVSSGR